MSTFDTQAINSNQGLGANAPLTSSAPSPIVMPVDDSLSELAASMHAAADQFYNGTNADDYQKLLDDYSKVWALFGQGAKYSDPDTKAKVDAAIKEFNSITGAVPTNPSQKNAQELDQNIHKQLNGLLNQLKQLDSQISTDVKTIQDLEAQIAALQEKVDKLSPNDPNYNKAHEALDDLKTQDKQLNSELAQLKNLQTSVHANVTSLEKALSVFDSQADKVTTEDDYQALLALSKKSQYQPTTYSQELKIEDNAFATLRGQINPTMNKMAQDITTINSVVPKPPAPPAPPVKTDGSTAYFDAGSLGGTIWQAIHWHQVPYGEKGVSGETLDQAQVTAYFDELFKQLSASGISKIDCSFCTMDDIEKLYDATRSGGQYKDLDGGDAIGHMICEMCGLDSQNGNKNIGQEFFQIMTREATKSGIRVNLSFGGEDSSVKMPAGVSPTKLASDLADYMKVMGFTGCDWDIENGVNSQSDEQLKDLHTFWSALSANPQVQENTIAIEGGYQNAGLLADSAADASNIRSLMSQYYQGSISAADLAELKRICSETSANMKGCFSGVNLMLYGQQSYIAAKNDNWGIEGWFDLLGGFGNKDANTASKIHIGFRDDMDFKDPNSYATGDKIPADIKDAKNEGEAAAMIYKQLLENLAKDGYSTSLGSNFFWPQNNSGTRYNISKEGADSFLNVKTDGTNSISNVMSDFDEAMQSYTPPAESAASTPALDQTTRSFGAKPGVESQSSEDKNVLNQENEVLEMNSVQGIQQQREREERLEKEIQAQILAQSNA